MALHWGICSAGKISHDFVCALSTLDPTLHSVMAVAARSAERSRKFAELHQIPKSYASYEELASDDSIDIVYIGSINTEHLSLSKLFLNHNKNILCEKPMALNVKQLTEIQSLAKEKNLFCMEAVWSQFFPIYQKIREIIASREIGEVQIAQATFCLPILTKDHVAMKELGGGVMYSLGMYTAQFAMMVFGDETPKSVSVSGHLTPEGVDSGANITLLYPNNKMATLVYSGICRMSNVAEVGCTEGKIKIYPFWCPTHMEVTHTKTGRTDQFQFPLPDSKVKPFYDNATGLRHEAEAVRQAINDGKKEHPLMSHEASKKLATFVELVRNSLGYVIEGDIASQLSISKL
ncbi:trans-1,2-dihydrobenzene-1,2-diol dehydrogenase-like isoform X2 [Apostichopus japonicus]